MIKRGVVHQVKSQNLRPRGLRPGVLRRFLSSRVVAAGPSGPFGGHATLGDVVHYYKLDEESGVRADEVGSADFADINTVGYAAGLIDNAASFVGARSEYLSIDAGVGAEVIPFTSGEWGFSGWVYIDKLISGTSKATAGVDIGTDNVNSWYPLYYTTPQIVSYFYDTDGNQKNIVFNVAGGFLDADWNHLAYWCEGDGKVHGVINDNTPIVTGVLGNTQRAGRRLGLGDLPHGALPITALWDGVGIWPRGFTSDEVTNLNNGGAGLGY